MATSKSGPGGKAKKAAREKFVIVSNRFYGAGLKGTKIYYEGKRPARLRDDGVIKFGKNILEALQHRFGKGKFRWIITQKVDSVEIERGIARVRTSEAMLKRMWAKEFDRVRDVKNDIIQYSFYYAFPAYFTTAPRSPYYPGSIAKLLSPDVVKKMSSEDKDAMARFLPQFVASESVSSVNLLKASAQIESLTELATELATEIVNTHSESWWQEYIKEKILIIQQGYIRAIEKMNVAIGNTKFPDFCLVTHDNYLDILEIKKPNTEILKLDAGRSNYYFDPEMSRAIIQVENYLATVERHANDVRAFIKDNHRIDLKVVRPRGIILAGDATGLTEQKQRDDFRLLSHGLKHITVVTYDELLTRLKNYIRVLEQFTMNKPVDEEPKTALDSALAKENTAAELVK